MKIPLNGTWCYKVDVNNLGWQESWYDISWISKSFSSLKTFILPNNWNIVHSLEKYEGIVWYFRFIDSLEEFEPLIEKLDLFIEFKAVNYQTCLWINGQYCGVHEANFIPFKFKINPKLIRFKENNFIAVRVENFRKKDRIPTLSRDWFNWGGIYRNMNLLLLEKTRIGWARIRTKLLSRTKVKIKVDLRLRIQQNKEKIGLNLTWQLFCLGNLSLSRKNENYGIPLSTGKRNFFGYHKKQSLTFSIDNAKLWSLDDPQLYLLKLFLSGSKELFTIRFGIREIKTINGELFLNREKITLKGVSMHEELIPYGRAIPSKERRKDVLKIKKLGFNALRTGHYPHDESIYDICDEEGIIVLEEIPVYWGIDFKNPKVLRLAKYLLRTMILRDFNHPSIVMWSVGNEVPISNNACQYFIRTLLEYARKIDPSRLITCVLEFWMSLIPSKRVIEGIDVLCINQYIGWYYLNEKNLNIFLDCLNMLYKKPIFITEFGAGAKFGHHDFSNHPTKYSEERQVSILEYSIKVMNSKMYIKGWFIWIYRDFRSHMRLNKFQEGYNRKGIISETNQRKMIAQRMPIVINQKLNQIRHHKIGAYLFYFILYPLIRFMAIAISITLGSFSDTGDSYYSKVEI